MRVQSIRQRTLLVIPVRLALGGVWLVAARLAGGRPAPVLIAFAVGAAGLAFAALNDPRARLLRQQPEPLPAGAEPVLDPPWRHALAASFPSTVGVSVLAAIALAASPVLAALLGGVSAGLGIAALASVPRLDPSLLMDSRSRAVYRRELPSPPCSPGS